MHDNKDFPKKLEVRNWRHWAGVSKEELSSIATNLNTGPISADLLGANICFTGIRRLTTIPRGSIFYFPEDAILQVEDENRPCSGPGKEIQKIYKEIRPGDFYKAAMNLRGLVGVVYSMGVIRVNDIVTVKIYEPKGYSIPK